MTRHLAAFCALVWVALATPVAAQQINAEQEYMACLQLARTAPNDAEASAEAWEEQGGAGPARHCRAVALARLGRFAEAAEMLEALIGDVPETMKAGLLIQAGQAWLMADDAVRAYGAQTQALEYQPNDVELLIDRSITLAGLGRFWESIDDLNRASDLAQDRVDVYVYRATAYRFVEAYDLALEDVGRALQLDPGHPEGLMERGILRYQNGNVSGARQDWQAVVDVAPNTPAAVAARENLWRTENGGAPSPTPGG
ncbi:tetratricopeptide repeat protein [Algihabitans albus]|uniref:tetratricopeptide repeat protein n=1 Tax=Algihabitans albus TaxID=2164067 RepID=UPI000E5D80B5|nr:tetratricopeptide repeat protein [Algihabitans albus]